jgi:hypothetical protein
MAKKQPVVLTRKKKLCVFCPHFEYDRIYEWHSDESGGTEGGFNCKKGHFLDVQPYNLEEFRKLILRAEQCPDYQEPV